ncbi:MAG: hypothetical protein B7Y80_10145 [Hyphomicrobium sp. 32-62-53]|nr:MAG: hypothetical protein B7Z29_08585 [Hyphomicrobium sp. 12-62-95]OYX99925.1 MAG: hypothetical protein B7Y80_10145 [Hyphomicrobium sp. 32-62-53]
MLFRFRNFNIALFFMIVSVPSFAATVTPSGQVFIDRGQGYQQISGPTEAKSGDVVMAMAGGNATITYENGCQQAVDVGAVGIVSEVPPCLADAPVSPGIDYTLVIGGVAVAGGVAAAIALSGGDDKCASGC